jgi:hypothetical protein
MKLRNLFKELLDYNLDAEVNVIAHCTPYKFSLSYGSSEGVEKSNCDEISFYVDALNTDEHIREYIEKHKDDKVQLINEEIISIEDETSLGDTFINSVELTPKEQWERIGRMLIENGFKITKI